MSVSASVESDKTMIEKTNVTIDMANVSSFDMVRGSYSTTRAMSINGVKQHWMYITDFNGLAFDVSADSTTFGYPVMKMVYNDGFAMLMFKAEIISTGAKTTDLSCSEAVVEGRTFLSEAGKPNWKTYPGGTGRTLSENLKANVWYDFKVTINPVTHKMVISYVEELSAESSAEGIIPHSVVDTHTYSEDAVSNFRYYPGTGSGGVTYFDDFKMYYTDRPYEKAEITNIGTANVVDGGQNVVPVTLSADIPAITKDHITVTQKGTNQVIPASAIEITSDGTNPVVKATLASNLASWSEYTVTIDAQAFGEWAMQRTGDADAVSVTAITKDFETTKPHFATKGFEFTASGDNLNAKGLVVNTTGTPKDIKLVFSSFNSSGEQVEIAPTNYNEFNDSVGDYLEANINTDNAEKFNFFIIDNWTNKTPLLGISANVDANGDAVAVDAVSAGALSGTEAAISADELNHDTLKLSVRVDTKSNSVVDGILFVYKKGEALSDTNLPLYAKTVSTAADGTLSKVIPLSETIEYGEFTVEFSSNALTSNLADNFKHCTPAELLEARKAEILADAKSAVTTADLKEVLLGLNVGGETVNSNFDIVGSDADMTNYEAALDKDNIFTRMLSSVATLGSYDELITLFEEASAAQVRYEIENPTIMIESNITTVADTRNTVTYAGTTGNWTGTQALMTDSVKNHWFYISNSGTEKKVCYDITNDTSFGGSVVKLTAVYPLHFQMFFGGNISGGANVTCNSLNGQAGTIEGRVRFTSEVTPYFRLNPEGGNNGNLSIGESLKADTWYNFKWEVVTGNYVSVTFTEIGSGNPHTVTKKWNYSSNKFTDFKFFPEVAVGEAVYFDDFVVKYSLIPYEKAKITSVGNASVVDGYQNNLSFELSNNIPTLTKDHITVTNKDTNDIITAESISVIGDSTQTVNVTLASNLAGWSEYELKIDPLAFGEGNMQRIGGQDLTEITALTSNFTTTKASFAAKPFTFTESNGVLYAKALVANTTGSTKDMQFVFSGFDADGRIVNIISTEHNGFSSGEEAYFEASTSVQGGKTFNFFVIDDWSNRNPLFGANYNVNAQGETVSLTVSSAVNALGTSPVITLGDFDYTNIKLAYELDTKYGKTTDGIFFVYKNGETLSSSNLPVYAKSVSTATDGTLSGEIILPKDLPYGAYTVEFVSQNLGNKVTKTFRYYTPDEILANKRTAMFYDAKAASDATLLSKVIYGLNSEGEVVNDNFDVFGKDTNMTAFNKIVNKTEVFTRMLASVSSLTDYNALVSLFETVSSTVRAEELAAQKNQMVSDAKACVTAGGLMQVILGVDANGDKVNDNFDVISSNADMSVYNILKYKSEIYAHMLSSARNVNSFSELLTAFENAARTQQSKENTKPSVSSNNSSYGGASTPVKERVETPTVAPGQSASSASFCFVDMNGHWAQLYVQEMSDRGIMNGYEDGSFRGENNITRAELAKTLVEAFGIADGEGSSFADVSSDKWYAAYIARASKAGIINGFVDGSFGPDEKVTRQDAALMLYRAMSIGRTLPIGYTFFNDDLDIADYASGAIRTLGDLKIVNGSGNKEFKPNSSITRAEVATIICRAIDYIESH